MPWQGERSLGLPASVSAIYLDLRALESEFEEVEIDLKTHELVVTTDAIELDGVLLGEFQIRLTWTDIGDSSPPYRVVALDPHPSARRDDVTHPHVQDEQLCEGEGRTAIAAALADSRFHDFFLLVNRLLHTYGRGTPTLNSTPGREPRARTAARASMTTIAATATAATRPSVTPVR